MSEVMFDKILGRIREGGDEGGGGGGNTPKIITINAINALTTEQCESLNAGDVVVVAQNGVNYTCVVTSKTSSVIYLCYIYGDNKEITKVRYTIVNGEWGFENMKRFPLATPLQNSMPQYGMVANTVYVLGELNSDTTFALFPATDTDIANIWYWTFNTGATAPMITWPAQITMWVGGYPSYIEPNSYYEVRVMNGVATILHASSLDASNSYNSDFNNDF